MKYFLVAIPFLIAASCTKEAPCNGASVTCTHTIYYAYVACPDLQNSGKWIYSDIKSSTETFEMSDCDSSGWLAKTRQFDENWKIAPNNPSWEAFTRIYPNTCGCE